MLSPNALRILDVLGVYKRICGKGFNFETLEFKNYEGKTTDEYYFGSEKLYGYKALRIYRQVLIDELLLMLKESGIPIEYEKKFSHIISEARDHVSFSFTDGTEMSASILIGADGIHSRVRQHIYPTLKATFSGFLAVTTAVPTSKARIPENYHLPATIMAEPGVFVIAPQDVDGSELLIGTQRPYPELDRAGWDRLRTNQPELLSFLKKDFVAWPDIAQSALENVELGKISAWPFYTVPRLERWASSSGRVVILGDAAHAIPPTAGQGVNQAFEDVYMMAALLARLSPKITLLAALDFWHSSRQDRVDKVLHLTKQMNAKRLPLFEQAKLAAHDVWRGNPDAEGAGEDLAWLYGVSLDRAVSDWVTLQESA